MSKTAMIRARTEPGLKMEVEKILMDLGLTCTEAINLFFYQVKLNHGLPFDVKIPNRTTLKAMAETVKKHRLIQAKNQQDLFRKLGI